MQHEVLGSLNKMLYPSESAHREEIEACFGGNLLRPLTPEEERELASTDLFFVVFSNRSGSTYLTELLHLMEAGIHPRAEQMNGASVRRRFEDAAVATFTDYFLAVLREQRKDGRVGLKISPAQLFWVTQLGLLQPFRSVRLINSLRRDRVAQAASHAKARATGQWHSLMPARRPDQQVEYSREEMLRCLRGISRSQELLSYYSSIHQPPLLDIVYEHVLEDPRAAMTSMAEFLQIPGFRADSVSLDAVGIQPQRNQDNERLCEAFRREFAFSAPPAC